MSDWNWSDFTPKALDKKEKSDWDWNEFDWDWNEFTPKEPHSDFSLSDRVFGTAATGLLGLSGEALSAITGDKRYRNIAPAYAKRAADSIAGFTVGLGDTLSGGALSGLPDEVSTVEESAKTLDTLTKFTPSRMAQAALKQLTGVDTDITGNALKEIAEGVNQKMGWKDRQKLGYTTVREEMFDKAQDDINFASENAQGIAGDLASSLGVDDEYIDPLKQVVGKQMQMLDTGVMLGAPVLAGMGTSALAASAGLGNAGRLAASIGEGVVQGIGDNPQAPLAGAALSAGLSGIGGGIPLILEKNALKANVARLRGDIEANSGKGMSFLDDDNWTGDLGNGPLIVRPIDYPDTSLLDGHEAFKSYVGKDVYDQIIGAPDDQVRAYLNQIDPTTDWSKLSKWDAINEFGTKLKEETYKLNRLKASKVQLDEFGQTTFTDSQTGAFGGVTLSDSVRESLTHEGAPDGPLIILDSIKSNGSGTGGGTRVLHQIMAYSDEIQTPIALRAVPFGDPDPANIARNKEKLFKFYENNGFKKVQSESGDVFVYLPDVVVSADDPDLANVIRKANKYGAKVKINPAGPTAQQLDELQEGSIPWVDARIAELERLQTPPKYESHVKSHLPEYEKARAETIPKGKVQVIAHKIRSMFKSRDSIGGFRHNVSFSLAKASVKEAKAKTFVDEILKEEVHRQPGVGAALAQSYIDDVVPLEILISRKSTELGMSYDELNESIGKAVRMKRPDTIADPEIRAAVDKLTGGLNKLRDTFIRNGLQKEKAEAIIYRAQSYLTRSYIGADPDDVINGLVANDPVAYAKVIEWEKRKVREHYAKEIEALDEAGQDSDRFVTDKAVGQLQKTIKPETETGASAGKKAALGTTNEDVFETTQGAIEKKWTEFQKTALEKIRYQVDETIEPVQVPNPKFGQPDEPEFLQNNFRLEIDSTFDTFLEKVGPDEARRIKGRFVNYAIEDLGLHVPPGEKVDYMNIRRALSEERKEFLFREAIRQEDMPDFVAKALGAKMGFTDAMRETLVKVTHNHSVTEMLSKIRDEGIAKGVVSPVGPMPGWEEIKSAGRLGILGEYQALYAPKYIAAVINQSVDTADAVSMLYTLNTRMKAGKVLSQAQTMVNFMSGGWSAILQGDLSPMNIGRGVKGELTTSAKVAIKSILAGDTKLSSKLMANPEIAQQTMAFFGVPREKLYSKEFGDMFIDMMKRGVVGGGSGAEIEQVLKLRQAAGYGLDTNLQKMDEFISGISRYYQSPDIFWKSFGYQNRVKDLMYAELGLDKKALRSLDLTKVPEHIKDRAARLVTDSYQSYDKTPTFFKNLSKNPLGPSFITYPVEALRNNKNIVLESMEYSKNAIDAFNGGDLAKAARYSRMAVSKSITFWGGMAALYYGVQKGAEEFGLTEDKKALIDEVVQFKGQRGNPMFVTGYDPETHQIQFIDLGNMNPFPHIAKLARVLDRDTGQTLPQRMDELVSETAAIFAPMGILPRALAETATGRSVRSWFDTNGANYVDNPNAPGAIGDSTFGEQQGRKLYRAYRSMAPSVLTQSEHVLRGIADEPLGSRKFSIGGEIMYQLTGIRPNDVDLETAYFYALRNTTDQFKSVNISYRNATRDIPESDQKRLAEVRKAKQAELETLMLDGMHYVESMRKLNFSDKEIKQLLKKMNYGTTVAVMNNKIIEALMKGNSGISITEVWERND